MEVKNENNRNCKKTKEKRGISLIVLVITIVVMVILAGAIVLTLDNTGIFKKASEAVELTNKKNIEEMANLAWAEAYASGERTVEDPDGAGEKVGLKKYVENYFAKSNVDLSKYTITVTTKGVKLEIEEIEEGIWEYDHASQTVKKGETVLEIGDYVDYKSNVANVASLEANNKAWRVLGADEEGNLLLMSAIDVKEEAIEEEGDILTGFSTYVATLDAACETYGNGEKAVNARSIKVEDVDKITGYDAKTMYEAGNGELEEYGNKVTYYWTSDEYPYYTGTNGVSGNLEL